MLGIHALVQTRLNWVFCYWEYFHQEYYANRLATSMSMFSILSYSCKRSVTYQLAGITGNSLWIWCSFLLVSLKTFLVILLCFFNHLPSWYVEWRTSATSSGCRRLPPSSSVAVRDSVWAHRVPTADLWYHVRLAKEVSHRRRSLSPMPVLSCPPSTHKSASFEMFSSSSCSRTGHREVLLCSSFTGCFVTCDLIHE